MKSTLEKAKQAWNASLELANMASDRKDNALNEIAEVIDKRRGDILEANARDCIENRKKISKALYKRLELTEEKVDAVVEGVRSLMRLPDPVGQTQYCMQLDEGLELFRVSVPIGVIGAVFESRPNVVVDVGSLCLKSGNAVILKGGSEAKNSNKMLYELMKSASEEAGVPRGWIQFAETREEVSDMLGLDEYIDLMIPRGSNEFVKYIQDNTRIPVLGHAAGVCHVYVDKDADLEMALKIAYDSKCQYPAVCNAMETLLVDKKVAKKFLPKIWAVYRKEGVKAKADEMTLKIVEGPEKAVEEDWSTEYNDMKLNIKVVDGIMEAVEWINRYGSGHTDSIVTSNNETARYFLDYVDSSSVMWNASTRFSDGYRYGLGAEVGISTNKIHARGPVGLEGLVIYKWMLVGHGQTVSEYKDRGYTHRRLNKKWV